LAREDRHGKLRRPVCERNMGHRCVRSRVIRTPAGGTLLSCRGGAGDSGARPFGGQCWQPAFRSGQSVAAGPMEPLLRSRIASIAFREASAFREAGRRRDFGQTIPTAGAGRGDKTRVSASPKASKERGSLQRQIEQSDDTIARSRKISLCSNRLSRRQNGSRQFPGRSAVSFGPG
jgi:hypothetical protein